MTRSSKYSSFLSQKMAGVDPISAVAERVGTSTANVYEVLVETALSEDRNWLIASNEDLAEAVGCHPRTIRRAISKLRDAGLVRTVATYDMTGARGPNKITINKLRSEHLAALA
jgi:DNA-binding Lrp family transcriptional regulator